MASMSLLVKNARVLVDKGQLAGVDVTALVERHNALSRRLLQRAGIA